MSTSSLTALPSSYPEKSDAIVIPEPAKPVRKTYGRRREPTPPADDAGPSLSSMFTTSRSPPRPTRPIQQSPSKALLNRWSTGDASWKTSLLDLGMDKDEDDEVDAEEIEREIARMRANARGEKSSPKRVELPAPTHEVAPRKFPIARLQATTSSSTLTTAPPTSPLRSSPPPRSALAPVNRASPPSAERAEKARELANMFNTSSDHEATQDNAKSRSSSPTSHRSVTPTPATRDHRVSRRSAGSSAASTASATPVRSTKTKSKTKKNRLDAFMADLDDSDDERIPTPRIESRVGSSPNVVDNFLATLQQSDDEEEAEKSSSARALTKTSSETVALFDEEEEERERAVRAGKSKIKGLKKQELEEMRRDIARNQRSKRVEPFKPQVDRLPISSWAANAAAMLNSKPPALVKDADSPVSSPHQVTPEEITAFTPSSTARQDKKRPVNAQRQMIVPGTSSPTPLVAMQEEANMPDWDEEIKPLPSLKELMAEDTAKAAKAEFIEARRRVLQRRKQEQLKNLQWTGGHDKGHSDDDLSIMPKAQPAVRFADVKPSTSRNARNVLEDFVNSSASSRRQQAVLQFTGKRSSGNEDLTETMVDFAGKTFKHGDLKNMNGGSRPAGQKANKTRPITARDLDVMMREKHRLQAQKIQQTKEKAFGVRKRPVPSRESIDFEAQIEELRAREAMRMQYDEEEEDEDEEDEDYQGSGDEEDGVEGGDEDEVQYSGEEDAIEVGGDEEEEDQQSEAGTEVDADQENQPLSQSADRVTESIEQESPLKRSSLPHRDSPPPNREPLADIRPTQTDNAPAELDSTFVDISGFGSGGGSPGFSQLFEATQMPGATGTDAFAGLREQPAALMPIHAMLPQVDISATQIERDNAMIAAETEGDLDMEDDRPKTQYMNDRGLFTQTKPAPRPHVEASSSRNNLAGSSSLFDFAPQSAPEVELSSTQRDTSEGEVAGDSTENSVSPRRHRSPSTAWSEDDDEAESRPTDAFVKLMAADQRPLTKHQKQAKARIRSNLVDEQADESDEDNWLMPGQKNEDEEEEDEDQDAFLPELVDDQEVSEEDRMKQDALVAQKNREIQLADDAKREAEARKVTEGQYRTKRRGQDFYSDDEDGTPRKKRWSKKQMRQRKIWKEDGLDKLDGEENVFMKLYEKDLDSDVESVDEAPSPRKVVQSPVKLSERERKESIRRVAEMNKARHEDDLEIDLDQELGLDETVDLDTDTSDVETFQETAYSVSRVSRHSKIIEQSTRSIRSTESYQNFVRDESLVTRRVGTIGGASVVYNSKEVFPARTGFGNRQYNGKPPARAGSGSSGSILLSKTNKFA